MTSQAPRTTQDEPRTEDWVAHGLAAMDELRRLYFKGSADRGPGDITVKDWQPCEDAIRSAFAAALPAAPAGLDLERLARAEWAAEDAERYGVPFEGWWNDAGNRRRVEKIAAAYAESLP